MTEPSLELILEQQKRILDELRDMRAAIARIEHELMEQRQDIASLARVMLRLESRIYALEEKAA